MVSSPTDPAEPRFATRRILAWHQADPGSQVATRPELPAVVYRCQECRGHNGTDPRDAHKAPTGRFVAADCNEVLVDVSDAPIEIPELIQQLLEELAGEVGELGFDNCLPHLESEARGTLWQHDPVLGEQASGVVDQRGAVVDQAVADAME